jgi:uncharacterized membrane protein
VHTGIRRRITASGVRVTVMFSVGVLAFLLVALAWPWTYALLVGWAAACLVYVCLTWLAIGRMDAERTRAHATREDPSRPTSDTLLLLASVVSLVALAGVLVRASSSAGTSKVLITSVAVSSLVLSWAFVHTLYTLHYAVLYYSDTSVRAIDFNQDEPPRYLDFAYVAFSIGMTFQVSDTSVRSSAVRSAALGHALLSYLFGAVILASAVNVVAGLGG